MFRKNSIHRELVTLISFERIIMTQLHYIIIYACYQIFTFYFMSIKNRFSDQLQDHIISKTKFLLQILISIHYVLQIIQKVM
jgi:hypothetical protein